LINKLIKLSPKTLLEWGYGTGFTSIAMANKGYKVQAYDTEPRLLEFAAEARRRFFVTSIGSVEFTADSERLRRADVVYSQGLFIHRGCLSILTIQK